MSHWRFWRNTFASKRPCSILIGRSGRGWHPHGCVCSGQSRKVPHSGQGAAMTYAVHCVGRCSALRWLMHRAATANAACCAATCSVLRFSEQNSCENRGACRLASSSIPFPLSQTPAGYRPAFFSICRKTVPLSKENCCFSVPFCCFCDETTKNNTKNNAPWRTKR